MNGLAQPHALHLLRLIIELRSADIPSDDFWLGTVGERDPEQLAAELAALEGDQLIAWSERAQQWTPTLRGLAMGLNLPAFEPDAAPFTTAEAECA
ncbi:hypothetical protein G6O69_29275 [Pseudenhygromyxa sp. WMMC2535]|uniref:hypothetical protein n=1 Tax=Pseudenhygromyxa sp. WMMC2535 TaxID=2712867 RepID=UPI001551FD79|nr:hypothetical protein [Pseudenhygromyxa sp. WMMC2535]NVB41956.1 hypothetical protein [Pseudenhygromyxa sp. WMMC2535]